MATLVRDVKLEEQIREDRRLRGSDRWDEVWEGVYVMAPLPNDEHQELQAELVAILQVTVKWTGLGDIRAGVNVSDREDWTNNYRCPDVAAFMKGTTAVNRGTFWLGGPDFAVEIVSPDDASRDKLEFYGSVGVRELLVVDRHPWKLELYRLRGRRLELAGESLPGTPDVLTSDVVPLSFRLLGGASRPLIEVAQVDGAQRWTF